MILTRTYTSSVVVGALLTATVAVTAARCEDYVATGTITASASRCADFGPDFLDMGNGICGRVGTSSRVQLGTRNASVNAWGEGETSHAALQSDSMVPGANMQHLRVRHGLESPPY